MKKPTILKSALLLLFFFVLSITSGYSQSPAGPVYKTFVREHNSQIKGDILTIGNNILNRRTYVLDKKGKPTTTVLDGPNTAYDGTGYNGNFDMYYINIDKGNGTTDGTIFSSSRATLQIPNSNAPATPCYRVAYAALYWSGIYEGSVRTNINKVKIKVPNTLTSGYQDIEGKVIHDIANAADGVAESNSGNKTQAYACFADITSYLNATDPNGDYTVANVIATEGAEGTNGGTGLSAGWSLFIVYEDANLPTKAISSFNGFASRASSSGELTTTISGFTTIPTGPVQARFAFAALEGDRGYNGDYLKINGSKITPAIRPLVNTNDNFFNSTINSLNTAFTARFPNSSNTLGFDAGVIDIDASSKIIGNGDTSADISLGTKTDVYMYYFMAFSVDIIAPKIVLSKGVFKDGLPADNLPVELGDELVYKLVYQNLGNDNAKSFTITDKLPDNTDFTFPDDIIELPGITNPTLAQKLSFASYDTTNRIITFTIPDDLVKYKPRIPEATFRFKVRVVNDCAKLTNACSNLIANSAFSSYFGDLGADPLNPAKYGDGSFSSAAGCSAIPQSTNFLVGLEACRNRKVVLCGSSRVISASGGYKSYSWSTSSTGLPVIGTGQTLTITKPGTYYVNNTATPPCRDLQEVITVEDFDGTKANPIIAYADNKEADGSIVVCADNGKPLPKIVLCGTDDFKLIDLNISGATRIVWETTTCARPGGPDGLCANEGAACEDQWVSAGVDGPLFTAKDAGQYRVSIYIDGCFNQFYFDIIKKDQVVLTVDHKDILCGKNGSITAEMKTGYEYSLTNVATGVTGNYQDENIFDISQAGTYIVNYRISNLPNTCEFKSKQVEVLSLNLSPKVENPAEQPLCYGDKGSITVSASSGFANYYFVLYQGTNKIQEVGPLTDRYYTFDNLDPGKSYDVEVYTEINGTKECTTRVSKDIQSPSSEIELSSQVIVPLTSCNEGRYKISATGGSGGYSFFVDGSTSPQASSDNDNTDQNSIILLTPTAKDYTIVVRDSNLCEQTIVVKVDELVKPTYTVTPSTTAINCYGETAKIDITLNGSAAGYKVEYSIDNGATYKEGTTTGAEFLNLSGGTYKVLVRFSVSYIENGNTITVICPLDPVKLITITAPSIGISASAGVSSLAGCTLAGEGGLLRITNVEGGAGDYEFSFDGGATWQLSNEKAVLPGTYVLKVRDKLLCEYKIPYDVILRDKPTDPTITVDSSAFNCNGTATSTVTVTNTGNGDYTYEYLIDGKVNPNTADPKVFLNVPAGPHTITVNYKLVSVPTPSNLLFEDFGNGDENVKSPGASPNFCFEDQVGTGTCGTGPALYYGEYTVTNTLHPNSWHEWKPFPKDKSGDANGKGRFFVTDVGTVIKPNDVCYKKTIRDIIPNRPIEVEIWVRNLFAIGTSNSPDPNLILDLEPVGGSLATALSQQETGPVRRTNGWIPFKLTLNPGDNKSLDFAVRIKNPGNQGIDFAFDDIKVYQLPETCLTKIDFPIDVPTDKAFTASADVTKDVSCAGAKDGEITITAANFNTTNGYQYSLNGGTDWLPATTSPLVLKGLDAGTYDLKIRYDSTPSGSACVQSFAPVIKTPDVIIAGAAVSSPAKCSVGATITASGQGGSGDYLYQLKYAVGGIYRDFQAEEDFLDVPAGDYEVFVKDVNACVSPVGVPIKVDAPATLTAVIVKNTALCFDGSAKITVNVSGGTGTYTYQTSINGAAYGGTSAIFTGPSASFTYTATGKGTYKFKITDNYGCFVETTDQVINAKLTAKIDSTTELNCDPAKEAVITGTITGGTAPFVVTVLSGTGPGIIAYPTATTFTYTTAIASIYKFQITDNIGCVTNTTATVKTLAVPIATPKKTDISCNNYNDGTITVTGSNGVGTYTYAINKGAGFVYQTTAVFTGLAAGTYFVKVKDSKGCESEAVSVTIVNPDPVTATISATELGCSSTGTKAAIVTIKDASGGAGGYTYSFKGNTNYTAVNTYSTTSAETVTAYIKDKNGCEVKLPDVIIGALSGPTGIDVFFETGLECPAYTAHVKFQTIGGQSPIRYQVVAVPSGVTIPPEASGQYNLPPGDYTFTATDRNGCSFPLDYNVKSVPDITTGGSILTPIKCFGDKGKIQFTVTGVKDKGYDYVITNSAGTIIQQDTKIDQAVTVVTVPALLAADSYTIAAKDRKTNCTSVFTVKLTQPAAALFASYVKVNANCDVTTSKVTVTAVKGTAPYTYAYMKDGVAPVVGNYVPSFTANLNPNTSLLWDVWVKDANGCTYKLDVTIAKDSAPTVTASVTDQCTSTGNSFKIKAVGSGGVGPYTYTISSGAIPSPADTFTVTSAGKYTITVRDANNCTATTDVMVYGIMTASAVLTKDLSCGPVGSTDAIITINAGGGLAPYSYKVSSDGGATYVTTGITGNKFTTATAGNYQFQVTDSNIPACIKISNVVKVTDAVLVTAKFDKIDPNCFNSKDGSITLTGLTGEASFTYSIDNGVNFSTSNVFGGLGAGSYDYIVRDKKGCDATGTIILANPAEIKPDIVMKPITCDVNTLGSFEVSVLSGGVAPFTYKLYDNSYNLLSSHVEAGVIQPAPPALPIPTAVHKFTGLSFGDYYITIVDASGCEFKSAKLRIETPPYLKLTGAIKDSGSCKDGVDVTVTTSGGVPDYKYSIFGQPAGETGPITSNTHTFLGLKHGTKYFLQVKDANGCISILEIDTPPSPSGIAITGVISTNVTCTGTATGTLKFTVSGYSASVTKIDYEVLNALTLMPLATPVKGTLTGAAGGPVAVDVPPLSLFAGNYVLRVSEVGSTECSATYPFAITQAAQPLTSIVKKLVNATCNSDAQVTLETKGGTTPYKYAAGAPGFTPASGDFGSSNVLSLKYATRTVWDIVVQDASGCVVRIPVTIALDPSPEIDLKVTNKCVAEGAFEIIVSELKAGVGPYSISVNNPNAYQSMPSYPGTPYKLTGLNSGVYDIYVKDKNGCFDMKSVTILAPLSVSPFINALPTCVPDNDGKITLTPSGGSGTFTYDIFPRPGTTSIVGNVISGLPAGTYTVTMTDTGTACTATTEVKLSAPTPVTFTTTTDMVSCNGASDGVITVNLPASNNNPVYTYTISPMPLGSVQLDNVFSKLPSGTYTITVKSGRGCSTSDTTVFVGTPATLITTAQVTPFGCNTSNTPQDALVTVAIPTTGTAPYSYSFNNGPFDSSNTFSVDTPKRVDYVVLDKNGCMFTDFVIVDAFTPPIDMTIVATPIYCNTTNGESTVTVTEVILKGGVVGTGTYTYEIIAPIGVAIPNTTGVFSKLLPGTYQIKVTDATGCSKVKTVIIEKASEIAVDAQLLSDVLCNGDTTGSIAFTISNYITPADYKYDFTIMPATGIVNKTGNVVTYTGLPKGDYTFTVTDNISGCEKVIDFSIAEPAAALDFNAVATNINCTEKGSTITVNAIGGTKNYGYAVAKLGALAPTVFGANPELNIDTNNGVDLDWVVYVQDANGCALNKPLTILLDASPVINTAVVASQCPSATGTYDIIISATGVGPLEYSIGNGFTTNTTITVDAPGTYVVTVRDKNGCTNPVAVSVTILEPLLLDYKTTGTPICNGNQGEVTLLPSGGTGVANYVYSKDNWASFQNTPVFSSLVPGTYTFSVRDNGTPNQCTKDVVVNIEIPNTAIDFSLTPEAVICNGESNGSIIVNMATTTTAVNNNPIYSFVLTDTASGTIIKGSQTTTVFNGLAAGNYTVIVTSGKGCPVSKDVTVLEPKPIVVSAPVVTAYACTTGNSGNFATITVDPVLGVTGGSGKYVIYEFFRDGVSVYKGSNTIYKELDFLGGSYTVKVYDNNACTGTSTIATIVDPFIRLDKANVKVDNAITCNNLEDITVSTTIIGGTTATLEYSITDAAGNAIAGNPTNQTGVFVGLAIGHYIITVNNLDTNCSIKTVHYVNNPNTFAIKVTNVTNVVCYGAADGSVDLTFVDLQPLPGNEAGIFDYTITGPVNSNGRSADAGPVSITGLKAGLYTVTATLVNKPGCTVSTNFTIDQPKALLEISESHTAITCIAGNNDGTISVTATGGWDGGYEYEVLKDNNPFSAYSTQTEYTGLTAGVYTINVRDSKGCIDTETVTLTNPTAITVTAVPSTTLLLCKGDKTATLTATNVAGGQGTNYLYTLNYLSKTPIISSGVQADPVFTGLGAGTYSITVTDGWNCGTESAAITIDEPTKVLPILAQSKTPSCLIPAELTLSATGGTAPYQYSTDAAFTTILGTFATSTTFAVAAGTYQYYVRDANNCVAFVSNGIKVEALETLVVSLNVDNAKINCKGDATGVIVAKATGGLGNYVYTLLDAAGNAVSPAPVQSTPGRFDSLAAGNYSVKVDSGDCNAFSTIENIEEPLTPLTSTESITPVNCNGAKNGRYVVTASGGTGKIQFAISPRMDQFFDIGDFEKLEPGDYEVIVQDELGCFHINKFTITEPTAIAASVVAGSMIPEICAGDNDGAFDISVSGGTAPYSVSLDKLNGTYTQGAIGQDVFVFDNISGGMHIVYIKDAQGCIFELEVAMANAVVLNPQVVVDYACVSNAGANKVTVLVDASITNPDDVDFSLDGVVYQDSNVFTNLAPGPYTIMARHTNGCIKATAVFDIEDIAPLELALSDGGLNEIVATATGGGGDYQYSLNGESYGTTNKFIIYKSGNYTVTVTDKNGCTATATRYFEYIDVCIPNHFTPNGDGVNDEWGPGCTINYKNLDFIIFDRYGRQIAKYNLGQKWNGKYNGAELPSGDYWYILKLNDPKDNREFIGHFTLYR